MALIGEIRQRSWILIVFIGLGMGGFLLMDMLQNNSNIGGGSTTVGEIAGKDISITEFQRRQEQLYGNSTADQYQIREGVWQYYVREALIQNEAEALGLGVSDDELSELMYGPNPQTLSPLIRQAFGGQTGQVDMNQLAQIRQQVEGGQLRPDELAYWKGLTEQIKLDRLESKINAIATAAIYAPSWMAEMMHNVNNQKADFRFVAVPYATVNDDEIKVSDKELKAYISENKGKFMSEEETRKFSYVLFNVQPTQGDSVAIMESLNEEIVKWEEDEVSDSLFIVNSLNGTYSDEFVAKDQLAPQIADTIAKLAVGTIIAPYVDGSTYKIAKLINKQVVPDSVKARHILRRVDQQGDPAVAQAQYLAANTLIDSLLRELNAGTANFDSLAVKYGQDGTSVKGGDLGVFGPGAMVPEFNNLAFYKAEVGKYYKVNTQFGIHIVQVQNKYSSGKIGYQVGYIQENIIPSQDTEKDVLRKASKFAASLEDLSDLEAKAKKAGYEVQSSPIGTRRNDFRLAGIGEGEGAREILKWAYGDAEKGDVSNEVYTFEKKGVEVYVDKFAVIGLQSVIEEGLASIEDSGTRLQAETAVKNQKKAEMIMAKIKKGQTLDAIASANAAQVQTASQVSMGTLNVPGMGTEPKVVGKVFNAKTKTNEVLAPIAGNTAVYVIEVTFKPEATPPADLPTAKQQAAAAAKGQVGSRLVESLRKQTEVYDYRYRFF
jgi:peptidyl-prolyl cis-trans isomerase D